MRPVTQPIISNRVANLISNPQAYQVAAAPVDQGGANQTFGYLSQALSEANPKLQEWVQRRNEEAFKKGARDRELGLDPQDSKDVLYLEGYNRLEGYIRAKEDLAKFSLSYDDAPKDDSFKFDQFAGSFYTGRTESIKNKSVLAGYDEVFTEGVAKLRQAHLNQNTEEISAIQQARAQKWISDQVSEYIAKGQAIPLEHIDLIRNDLKTFFGTTGKEFNSILFNSLKEVSDQGHFEVWDITKQNRPDGTPGLYYIPEWQKHIQAAENHSKLVYAQKSEAAEKAARKQREAKQEELLTSIFSEALTGDGVEAHKAFLKVVSENPHVFRASEIYEWNNRFSSVSKERESPLNNRNAAELMGLIYTGKAGINDVLNAMRQGLITFKQAQTLQTDVGTYQASIRQLQASNKSLDSFVRSNAEQTLFGYLPITISEYAPNQAELRAAQILSRNQALQEWVTTISNPNFKGNPLEAAQSIGQRYRKTWDDIGWGVASVNRFDPNRPAPLVPIPKDQRDTSSKKVILEKVKSGEWTVDQAEQQLKLINEHLKRKE